MRRGSVWVNILMIGLAVVALSLFGLAAQDLMGESSSEEKIQVQKEATGTSALSATSTASIDSEPEKKEFGYISPIGSTSSDYKAFYTVSLSNVRNCPSLNCEVIDQLPVNTTSSLPFDSLSEAPEWIEVVFGESRRGYIHRSVFSESKVEVVVKEVARNTSTSTSPSASQGSDNLCGGESWGTCPDNHRFRCVDGKQGVCVPRIKTVLEEKRVDARSITALKCYFRREDGSRNSVRGSGVFVNSEGYILTNRHLVDQEYASDLGADVDPSQEFRYCEVRYLPSDITLTKEEARYNAYQLFNYTDEEYDWKADIAFVPDTGDLSEVERKRLDFAILKTESINSEKYEEGDSPEIIPAPILLPSNLSWQSNIMSEEVLVSGYAVQGSAEGYDNPYDFYQLTSKVGTVKKIYGGNKAYEDVPLTIETEIDTFTEQGRSGSPVFFRGHAIGVHSGIPYKTEKQEYLSGRAIQTSINAIYQNLGKDAENVFEDVVQFKLEANDNNQE